MADKQFLVQKNGNGKIKYHLLTLEEQRITREWGLVGGVIQGVYHDYLGNNQGRANELTPEMEAQADFSRIVKEKEKEGYIKAVSLKPEDMPVFPDPIDAIDLDNIPTGFCCSKPVQKITVAAIDKKIKSGNHRFFVKYNGGCHYIYIGLNQSVKIFTRRWDDHTTKYPDLVQAVKNQLHPAGTLMIVELCIDPLLNLDHMWAFKYISEIFKTNTSSGKCKADQSKCHALIAKRTVKAAVFGFLYYGGEKVWNCAYIDIWDTIMNTISPMSSDELLFRPQEAHFSSGQDCLDKTRLNKLKIEGFVLVDMAASFEVTMNGKPLRRLSHKIKARGEMDVIAFDGLVGKTPGKYGSIRICRMDPNMEQVDLGAVAGLKDKETDPAYWKFPCVIEVGFDNIFPDTGLLQFGKFNKVHEDKLPEEVDLFTLKI